MECEHLIAKSAIRNSFGGLRSDADRKEEPELDATDGRTPLAGHPKEPERDQEGDSG